jgi:hypothetical protein
MATLTIPASQIQRGDVIVSGDDGDPGRFVVVVWPSDQLDDSMRFAPRTVVQVREPAWPDYTLSFPMDQLVVVNR